MLLRLGFTARLRWELSDIFLSPTLSLTKTRKAAALFYLRSDEHIPPSPTSLLTIVQTENSYLTLSPTPSLSPTPTVLRLSIHPTSPSRILISLHSPSLSTSSYLSLTPSGPALQIFPTKHAQFHPEILFSSIGKPSSLPSSTPYLTPSQAITHALLSLGVRFRLRTAHNRVLLTSRQTVLQDAVPSPLQHARDSDLVLTAFLQSILVPNPHNHPRAILVLQQAESNQTLVISSSKTAPANLRTQPPDQPIPLLIQYLPAQGTLCLAANAPNNPQWLMAGPGGRLETRGRAGSWECFRLEFVSQSLDMALKEIPPSEAYRIAADNTRATVRARVQRDVANVKQSPTTTGNGKKEGSTFNHSAALAGLSEPPKPPKPSNNVEKSPTSGQPIVKGGGAATTKARKKAAARAVAAAGTGAGTATLPRNKVNRKAAKRNKKKQAARAAQNANTAATPPSANTDESKSNSSDSNISGSSATPDDKSTPSSSMANRSSRGPPCAACGRVVEGTYTTAMSKNFHPQCFCCGKCRRPMGVSPGQFRELDGVPYCHACYAAHMAARCARCSQPIMNTVTTAMDKTWHKECLTCSLCRLQLTQTFWLYADKPNEPRCSRCVTGTEDGLGRAGGNSILVNLPGFGGKKGPSFPSPVPGGGAVGPGQPGRARIMPFPPSTTRR